MRRPSAVLPLLLLLVTGMPSVLMATGLSLPSIPDFRLPSGGSVNTTFPAATGGVPPYRYSVSGLPPGITFDASTRGASGTLPTVTADTAYRVVYTARDSSGTIVDGSVGTTVRFTTTVTAPSSTVRRDPAPPGTIRPADPSDVPVVSVRRVHTLPFTASESGSGEKSYSFRLEAGTEVSVSLTGMNRDIDCRVNGSACTNRGGTQDDSWSGTLSAGTHTVTVYPYGGGSGNWTLSVSGRTSSPPPTGPTSTPSPPTTDSGQIVKTGVNVSDSRTYPFTLSHRADVSVELTGMTTDFDCTVSGNRCTNRGGTSDDSWTGTLDAGEHKIVVYPYGGGSGNYTLTISAGAPTTGGSTGTRTQVTTLVDTSETNISTSRTYNFTLARRARVDVALTGLTIDFDCRVGSSRCTNRWGTRDDSWSGDLGEGNHSVVVYPYDPGPGNYSLTVMATETVHFVATPLAGGPIRLRVCEKDRGGDNTDVVVPGSCVEVVIPGGEGNPDDGGDGDGPNGPGGPGGPDPADLAIDACFASSLVSSERVTSNPLEDDRALGSNHGGRNTARPSHSGIDVRASRGDAVMTPVSGTVTETASGHGTNAWDAETGTFATTYPPNGNFVRVVDSAGREHVFLHLHTVGVEVGDTVTAFQQIGTANNSGNSRGDHLHYTIWRNSSRQQALDPEGLLAACE